MPYWNNASTPYWDLAARGVMLGWTKAHGKAHVYRAIRQSPKNGLRILLGRPGTRNHNLVDCARPN